MRIAVIGSGVSGNVCAWVLNHRHNVTLFEANDYPGGHSNTVDISVFNRRFSVDTGFMVYNDRTYPNLIRVLDRLGIQGQPTDMSFSVRCDRSGLEYQGSSLRGLFAQRRNLIRPRFYHLLGEILRFNRSARLDRQSLPESTTLYQYVRKHGFSESLVQQYLLPMTAAIWSARPVAVLQMPARFLFQFFHNHGLLQIRNRPQWYTLPGGARRYVEKLIEPLGSRLRLSTPVARVRRFDDFVEVKPRGKAPETFDAVIFACHADQVLAMLDDPSGRERRVLGQFEYQDNLAILHTDPNVMPRRHDAWASWNYRVTEDDEAPLSVTYDLNRLQRLGAPGPIMVTLNDASEIAPDRVLREIRYQHPVFGPGTSAAQAAHDELNGTKRSYYCGAYWRYGFHEDGVHSALAVCRHFGMTLDSCTVASTPDRSDIGVSSRS